MAMHFDSHGVAGGCWTGILRADAAPTSLRVIHRGQDVATASLRQAEPGLWTLAAALPPMVIDEGVHALLLVAGTEGTDLRVLGSLTLIAGAVAGDDLLAEVALLRAELDLLKREFRRLGAG